MASLPSIFTRKSPVLEFMTVPVMLILSSRSSFVVIMDTLSDFLWLSTSLLNGLGENRTPYAEAPGLQPGAAPMLRRDQI